MQIVESPDGAKLLTVETAEGGADEFVHLDVRLAEHAESLDPEDCDCIYLTRVQVEQLRDYLSELLS